MGVQEAAAHAGVTQSWPERVAPEGGKVPVQGSGQSHLGTPCVLTMGAGAAPWNVPLDHSNPD